MPRSGTITITCDDYTGYLPNNDGLQLHGEGFGAPQIASIVNGVVGARGPYYERRAATLAPPPVELVPELPPHVQVIESGGAVLALEVDAAALAASAVEAGGDLATPLSAETAHNLDPNWIRLRVRYDVTRAEAAASADASTLIGLARYDADAEVWEYFGVGSVGKARQSGSPAAAQLGAYIKIGAIEDRVTLGAMAEARGEIEAIWRPNTATHYALAAGLRDWSTGLLSSLTTGAGTHAESEALTAAFEAFCAEARPCVIVLDSTGETGDRVQFFELSIS